jgi:hypothetical protein
MGAMGSPIIYTRLVIGAQQQDRLCTGSTPKEARPFQSQIDYPPNRAFNRTAANRKLHRRELGIRHATLVPDQIVPILANLLAIATPADIAYSSNDPFDFTPQQQPALLVTPAASSLHTPVFAQGRDFAKVFGSMIKVE